MNIKVIENQKAFTLLEVLVSLLIFAFVMVSLGYLMVTTVETNRDARRITAATNLAMDKIESMRGQSLTAAGYSSLSSNSTGEKLTEERIIDSTNGMYTRRWRVNPNSPEAGSTSVDVAVAWDKKDGTTRSVVINSVVVQP